ncbi:helix-turn-helix domain-containing protein [Sinomicrobium soli]|uniref:helix-turn-helix domain-containing protein n=1 Tax=Sinomicrobium sp. N-1-3-6 TaxID=2219864 RepID=UPI001374B75C|nr:helix-turn-helix domain-containing protein [Sinomicrobium sp. N-1-3-6]
MMKWTTTPLFIIFPYILCFSQDSAYDSIYREVSHRLLISQPEEALKATDHLYTIAANDMERTRALMLQASLLRQNGLKDKAIEVIGKADSLASLYQDYTELARINGLRSTLYRETGIIASGKKALDKAVEVSKKIEDPDSRYRFEGNLSQELAYYEMEEENHENAIHYLKKGKAAFKKMASGKSMRFHLAATDELIAENYISRGDVDSAFYHLDLAENELKNSLYPDSPLKGFIYNNFGNGYMLTKDYENALLNYRKALDIANTSNFYNLKLRVYNTLVRYYRTVNDQDNHLVYSEKRDAIIAVEEATRKAIADKLVQTLYSREEAVRMRYRNRNILIAGGSVLLIVIIVGIYGYRRKKDYRKFREFIDEYNKGEGAETAPADEAGTEKNYMSEETEEGILKSLGKFERSGYFLDKDISLNAVSARLKINNRYLSYVINKHKQKDFASYINELRINYIVDRLENDPAYSQYKISYLAEQCGFSSHSRFTVIFKKVTGISPSSFIKYLEKRKTEEQLV